MEITEMQQLRKELRSKRAATFMKQNDIQQDRQADSRAGSCEVGS
jgi:hypothetical protein